MLLYPHLEFTLVLVNQALTATLCCIPIAEWEKEKKLKAQQVQLLDLVHL